MSGLPSGGIAPIAPLTSPPPPLPVATGPSSGYQDAMSKLEALYGQRPQVTAPKWWQRGLGAVAGGLAGWSNASGHRQPPIDIAAMEGGILHPGYADKMAEWQSQEAPAQAQAQLEGQKQTAWWKNQEMQSQAAYMKAHADYMEGLGRGAQIDVTPEMESASHGIFKQGTKIPASTGVQIAAINAGKYDAPPEKMITVTDPDIAKRIGVPVGTQVNDAIYQQGIKAPAAARNLNPVDVLLHPDDFDSATVSKAQELFNREHREPREPAPAGQRGNATQFNQIQNRKNTRLLQAEAAANKQILTLKSAGDDEGSQAVYDGLSKTKQLIQDDYENEVSTAGGDPQHFDYSAQTRPSPNTAAQARTVAPAVPSHRYTEGQVRAAALAKNKDPEAAVRMARDRKLIP